MNALMDEPEQAEAQKVEVQLQLQVRLLHAIQAAIDHLARIAEGKHVIRHDGELRACVALAQLAPKLLRPNGDDPDRVPLRDISHPANSPEESIRLLEELEAYEGK